MKIKLTWRIWLWIIILIFAILSLVNIPNLFQKGVIIRSVEQNSSAFEQGLRANQIITAVDGREVVSIEDYSKIIQEKFNLNEKIKTTITTTSGEYIIYSEKSPEITVSNLEKTNIKTGLDLSGGARALVQAKDYKLSSSEINDLVNIVSNKFNVYGFSDITVRSVSDLSGKNFMLVEIAGATPKDLENQISQQGKFEAKIGNETVFVGGEKDITSVARGGQESGVYDCQQAQEGYFCTFRFTVYLSEAAAERHAAITSNISVNSTAQGSYLSKKLDLYLDDNLVDSLLISESLKGRVTTQIQISGSGSGGTQSDAIKNAEESMKNLQTILITGSLPFKLEIVKIDIISPTLGSTFTKYILIAGALALLSVAIIVFIKYRRLRLVFPPLLISTSEIIIILGIAAFVRQDLDLPGIAGILAAIGTGIDDQIVVLDEAEHKEESLNLKQKIKRAFTIVMGAFFTSAVSLLPLLWAGAGLLKGFMIMSLIGISLGVLVTRRAFADIVRIIEE